MPSGRKSRAARRKTSVPPPPVSSRRTPRTRLVVGAAVAAAALAAGLALAFAGGGSSGGDKTPASLAPLSALGPLVSPGPLGPPGPEGPPIERGAPLAPPAAPAPGASVDGIQCQPTEQVLFHIHARLTIFVRGRSRSVPYGIGIGAPRQVQTTPAGAFVVGGSCFAWLHTHAADGVIHIESPVQRTYTLGDFFDLWRQPLGPNGVGPARGHVTALVDGKVWRGSPRSIPLDAHAQIQLEVGKPLVAPVRIPSWHGL